MLLKVFLVHLWVFAFFGLNSYAQTNIDLTFISPKLGDFLLENPDCRDLFSKILKEAGGGRKFNIFYFYTTDESVPRSFHYYQSQSHVGLVVRENQKTIDEFICILYELINSENEANLSEIAHLAAVDEISRTDFPLRILKVEFEAEKRMRDLISKLSRRKTDLAGSHYYSREIGCPNDFDNYLIYLKKVEPIRDPIKEYEMKYDALQKPN